MVDETIVALPLADVIDIGAERDRLRREIEKVGSEIDKIDKKLANEQFISRAPEHVVDEQRERRAEAEAAAERLQRCAEAAGNRGLNQYRTARHGPANLCGFR